MVSVDGHTEGPGGDVMAMPMDLAFADHNAERAREARSFLFGATTYHAAVTYWPHQLEVPDMPESHYYIAQRYADGIPITVVSDSLTEQDTVPWARTDHDRPPIRHTRGGGTATRAGW